MASRTTNYNLIKPDQTDFYNVDDFNNNADKIDLVIKQNQDEDRQWVNDNFSKENLLINWDFKNVINQRGQTVYTNSSYTNYSYTVDRWRIKGSGTKLEVLENGVRLTKTKANDYGLLNTTVERNIIEGEKLTLSAIIDGVLYSVSTADNWVYPATGGTQIALSYAWGAMYITASASKHIEVTIYLPGSLATGAGGTIERVKLEKGGFPTLENDSPMDTNSELLVCQRYFEVMKFTLSRPLMATMLYQSYAMARGSVPYAVEKRILPTVTFADKSNTRFISTDYNTPATDVYGTVTNLDSVATAKKMLSLDVTFEALA
ncbi:MAG: hypothetical protein ACRCW1_04985, partial [Anaerotignaceae bacterium]